MNSRVLRVDKLVHEAVLRNVPVEFHGVRHYVGTRQQETLDFGDEDCADLVLNLTRSPAIAEGPRDAGVPVVIW